MQVIAGLVDLNKAMPGIANSDTELTREDVLLLMEHLSGKFGKVVEWKRSSPRHGITVSTVVGYLEAVLNNNSNGTPPQEDSESSL